MPVPWLQRLTQRLPCPARRAERPRLGVEELETRLTPTTTSVTLFAPTAIPETSQLVIEAAVKDSSGQAVRSGLLAFSTSTGLTVGPYDLANSAGAITLALAPNLGVGNITVTASYSGSGGYSPSSDTEHVNLFEVVDTAASIATATGPVPNNAASVNVDQAVTLVGKAVQAPGDPLVQQGVMQFFLDGVAVGFAPVDATGQATLPLSTLPAGSHHLVVKYDGTIGPNATTIWSGTAVPLDFSVVRYATETTLTSSALSTTIGQPVTFTATVNGGPRSVPLTGSVTFTLDSQQVTVPLSGTTASYTVTNLSLGTHTVSATYNGDGNFLPSTAATLNETVAKATTTTSLAVTPAPADSTQPLTLTATVNGEATVNGQSAIPTGTIYFFEDASILGTAAVSNHTASLVLPAQAAGTHHYYAAYFGDATFFISGSGDTPTTVRTISTVTLTESSPVTAPGQPVTFTATIDGTQPVSAIPSGNVVFTIDGTTVSVPLVGNKASYPSAGFVPGQHKIAASYAGDANFAPATSATIGEQVLAFGRSAVMLTASPSPATVDQPITLTGLVIGTARNSNGNFGPTGTVTFLEGTTVLGRANLKDGLASLVLPARPIGTYHFTAVYSGDRSFSPSSSGDAAVVVHLAPVQNLAPAPLTLTVSPLPAVAGQPLVLIATFTGQPIGGATDAKPTGTVTFLDGTTELAKVPLDGTQASYTIPALAFGGHDFSAVYSGDPSYLPGGSADIPLTAQGLSQTVLAVSPLSAVVGQPVVVTAKVTSEAGSPTGTVTFLEGTEVLGTVALSGGQAVYTVSGLVAGNHPFFAVYNGNGSFTSSAGVEADAVVIAPVQPEAPPPFQAVPGRPARGRIRRRRGKGTGGRPHKEPGAVRP